MSRHSSAGSYGHRIQRLGAGDYRLTWMVDRYYSGSRLRYPTNYSRLTDAQGARRFARKWGLNMPFGVAGTFDNGEPT
jgi:hypothetical protein